MKTYIKSILALATAALLGSSAWAAVSFNPTSVTVEAGKSVPVSLTGASGSSSSWSIQTQPSSCARASVSGTTLTVEGVSAGTTSCTVLHSYRSGSTRTETGTISITVTSAVAPEPDPVTSAVFNNQTITFPNGAVTNWVGGELVLKFKTGGTLNIPGNATADILAVGGGSAGVMAKSSSNNKYNGNGGNGGSAATATDCTMPAGSYTITVGAGAAKVTSGSKDFNGGSNGGNSSVAAGTGVTGFSTVTGNGGTAWTSQNDSGSGTKDKNGTQASSGSGANLPSTIAGPSYVYGKPGIPPPSNQVANQFNGADADEYGEGGQGSANGGSSGAGYQGIVIVRIKSMVSPKTEVTRNSSLILKKTAGATTHQFSEPLDASFTWGTISANPSGVVTASIEKTGAQPKMTVTPQSVNTTTLTVKGESDTEICTWTVSVTVNDAMPSVVYQGKEIEYSGATPTENVGENKELVLTFTDTSKDGFFNLPEDALVRVLVVGGGAGGATGKKSGNSQKIYNGSGGNGGEAFEEQGLKLAAGDYSITVGKAGNGVSVQGSNDFQADNPGFASSISGGDNYELVKQGGTSWTSCEKDSVGVFDIGAKNEDGTTAYRANDGSGDVVTTDISGTTTPYGGGGTAANSTSATTGTAATRYGQGGNGGGQGGKSGAGKQGIVIVRIISFKSSETLDAVSLEEKEVKTTTVDDVTDDEVIKCTVTDGTLVGATASIKGQVLSIELTGKKAGATTVMVETESVIYTLPVTIIDEQPDDGTTDVLVTQSKSNTVTINTTATRLDFAVSGDNCINTPTSVFNGDGTATVTITAKATPDLSAVIRVTDQDGYLIKIINVGVTEELHQVNFKGKTVEYLAGTVTENVGGTGDLLIKYTNTGKTGILNLPADVVADILVVGGGGSGSANSTSSSTGYGAKGGEVILNEEIPLPQGAYQIAVGLGGAAQAGSTQNPVWGKPGTDSSLTSFANNWTAKGGLGGGSTEATGTGTQSAITGPSTTYGKDGATKSTSGTATDGGANTGNGGSGGYGSGTTGAGGSGVVIVRLKALVETPVVATEVTGTVVYGQAIGTTDFAGAFTNSAGGAVTGKYAWKNAAEITSLTVADSGKAYDVVFTPENTTYYLPATIKGTLVVTPMAVTVYPIETNKVYGAEDPAIDFTTVPDVKGELTGKLSRGGNENAGDKNIVIGTLTNGNYSLTLDETAAYKKFHITAREITVTPVAGQEKTVGDAYTIAYETNGVIVAGDVFEGALAATDEVGEQEITLGTLAINDGNNGKNYDLKFTPGVKITVVPAAIKITIVAGTGVSDVQTNGQSVVGSLTLSPETTKIALELVKGSLTIPVFRVVTNDVTNVTSRVATYPIAGGLTLKFIADEAENDEKATPAETKQAIIDAIDPGASHDAAAAKLNAIVGEEQGQVPASKAAEWITENKISSEAIAASDFVTASMSLDADKVLTESDVVAVNSASGNVETAGIAITVQAGGADITANLPDNTKVQVKGTNDEGKVEMELVRNGDVVSMKPTDPKVTAYVATVEVLSDDGEKVLSSQKVGFLKKAAIGNTTDGSVTREFLSVPWASLAGDGDIALAAFLVTDNLAEDTKLYSYDSENKRYNAWVLNAQKIWEPIKTVKVEDGAVVDQDADTAEDAKIARGKAVWLERADATKPVVFVGQAGGEESVEPVLVEGWNAVSAPGYSDVDVSEMFPAPIAAEGDQIIVPGADEPEVIFTFKSSAWNYRFQKSVTIFGKSGLKVFEGTVGDGEAEGCDKIKAGTGFWYVKKAAAK